MLKTHTRWKCLISSSLFCLRPEPSGRMRKASPFLNFPRGPFLPLAFSQSRMREEGRGAGQVSLRAFCGTSWELILPVHRIKALCCGYFCACPALDCPIIGPSSQALALVLLAARSCPAGSVTACSSPVSFCWECLIFAKSLLGRTSYFLNGTS